MSHQDPPARDADPSASRRSVYAVMAAYAAPVAAAYTA